MINYTVEIHTFELFDNLYPFAGAEYNEMEILDMVEEHITVDGNPDDDYVVITTHKTCVAATSAAFALVPSCHLYKNSDNILIVNSVVIARHEYDDDDPDEEIECVEIGRMFAAFDGKTRGKQRTAKGYLAMIRSGKVGE